MPPKPEKKEAPKKPPPAIIRPPISDSSLLYISEGVVEGINLNYFIRRSVHPCGKTYCVVGLARKLNKTTRTPRQRVTRRDPEMIGSKFCSKRHF